MYLFSRKNFRIVAVLLHKDGKYSLHQSSDAVSIVTRTPAHADIKWARTFGIGEENMLRHEGPDARNIYARSLFIKDLTGPYGGQGQG